MVTGACVNVIAQNTGPAGVYIMQSSCCNNSSMASRKLQQREAQDTDNAGHCKAVLSKAGAYMVHGWFSHTVCQIAGQACGPMPNVLCSGSKLHTLDLQLSFTCCWSTQVV